MATIEEKLQSFTKLVYDNIKEEKQKEIDAFEAQKAEALEKEKQQLEARKKSAFEEVTKRAELKAGEIIAKEKLDRQRRVLRLKEQCVQDTMEALYKKLYEFADTAEYKEYLMKTAENIKLRISESDYILYVTDKDLQKYGTAIKKIFEDFKGGRLELKAAERDIIGGIIAIDSTGRFRIDNSLITILEDNRDYVGLKVTERLE